MSEPEKKESKITTPAKITTPTEPKPTTVKVQLAMRIGRLGKKMVFAKGGSFGKLKSGDVGYIPIETVRLANSRVQGKPKFVAPGSQAIGGVFDGSYKLPVLPEE